MSGITKKTVLFFDSGDTIIDESTEVRDYNNVLYPGGIVVYARAFKGMTELLHKLHDEGYMLILVADGYFASFRNMFASLGIYDCFYSFVTSEAVTVAKPDNRMFTTALGAAGLDYSEKSRAVMIGNNLARDIKGANNAGITSVFLTTTPRYPKIPSDKSEVPDYSVNTPDELYELITNIENENNGVSS